MISLARLNLFNIVVTILLCHCTNLLYGQSPVLVKDIYPGSGSGVSQSSDKQIVTINGIAYFKGTDQTHGTELWKSDGTEAGTVLVKDIYSGNGSSDPHNLTAFNGKLIFYAYDPQVGYCLFKSDGTEAGTVRVKILNYYYGEPRYLTTVNSTLFFAYNDGSHGDELWKSDGTEAGTVLVKDIYSTNNSSSPTNLINANGTLYFFATDATHGQELWKSDGTEVGTMLVNDIEPGPGNGAYRQLTAVGNLVFFIAAPYANNYPNYELWKSDGSQDGTIQVKELTPGSTYSNYISDLIYFNNTLYFKYSYNGNQLWKTDGTEAGTVKVFPAQYQGGSVDYLTKTSNSLYFFDSNNRLWKSDGTTAGTVLVKVFTNGFSINTNYNSVPKGIGNLLYFQAYQTNTGYELWKSDGTEAGTTLLPEVQPGTESSYPGDFTDVNGTLFFTATFDLDGRELYTLKNCQLPVIANQPANGSAVCAGSTVTATILGSGTGLSYQWYDNQMQSIKGATAATLTLTNVQYSQDGVYRCKVTNSCGSVTSNPYSLSVSTPPVINQHPSDQSICSQSGELYNPLSFYVGAQGNYLIYQWETRANVSSPWITLKDEITSAGNQAVSGATNEYLNIYPYSSYFRNGQQFRAKLTAANCSDIVYSNSATLTIISPIIITQPIDQISCGKTSSKFKVVANTNGGGTLAYQWQYLDPSYGWISATGDGFSGYTTNELTVSDAQFVNGRLFQVYIYNSNCGNNFYSNQVALITGGGIIVNTQPVSQTVCSSSNAASLSVAATATGTIQYQWQWKYGEGASWQDLSDGDGISGATTDNILVNTNSFYFYYYITAQYRVKMTTTAGNCPGDLYSSVVSLTQDSGPIFSEQPAYQNYVCTGGSIEISAVATGNGPLTYQWYKYNQTAVVGATSATLTLSNPQPEPGYTDYAGWYVCQVTNKCGTETSNVAHVYIRSEAPTISYQPSNFTTCSTSGNISFYARASDNDQAQWETRANNNSPWIALNSIANGINGAETDGYLYVYADSPYFRSGQQFRLKAWSTCTNMPVYSNPATLFFYNQSTFASQPDNQTVCVSATTIFRATIADDERYYSYSWQYNDGPGWVPIFGDSQEFQGYNQNQLTVSGSQVVNGRKFRLLATDNSCGSIAYSSEALLSVVNGVTVTTQPTNQTACNDGTVSFSVMAASPQTVSYQWQWRYGDNYPWQDIMNGAGYSGAATSKLTVTGSALSGGNQVRVKLQSGACPTSSYSNSASIITISPPYMYSNPPSSQTVCAGTPVTAELRAYYNRSGESYVTDNTLTYQWYRNNTIVSGASSATLSIPNATTASTGEYKVIITNVCGSVTSGTFTLYLSDSPLIYSHPNPSYEYCPGATSGIQLTALVYGQDLTFQWETRANSTAAWEPTPPTSQTSVSSNGIYKQPYYTVGNNLFQDGRQFRLKAGSAGCSGVTYTNPTTISVYKKAIFSTQPISQTVCASGTTSFSATAENPYLGYNGFSTIWQYFDGTAWQEANMAGMSGYTTSQLTISGAAVVNGRRFRMQAYNLYFNCVQAYSNEATVATVDAVAINTHPTNQTACSATGSASFSVAASGADSQYQWETGSGSTWTPLTNANGISGATTAVLSVGPGSYSVNGQQFRVKLTTSACPTPAYSNAATLNLFGPPSIYFEPSPASQIVCAGSQAGTSIQASSNLPLTYQWYLGTTPVSGATQNSFSISNVQAAQAGAYTVQVSNACGTVTSQVYSLSISQAPTVTGQPQPLTVCGGPTNNATFSVAAIGQMLTYQWQTRANSTANWVDITDAVNGQGVTLLTGATTPNLNIRPASEVYANGQQFRVRIYTTACQQEVFSEVTSLTIRGPLQISNQPTSVTVCNDGVASFSIAVNANSTGTPIYQWQYLNNTTWTSIGLDSDGFAGVGTSALTVSDAQLLNGRKFRALVYGDQCGGSVLTSAEVTLSITNGIIITGQPASQTVCNTGTASFMVTTTADEAVSYQWESFANNAWTDATNANGLNGVTSATLTTTGAALSDGRQFRVKLNTASCPAALYSNVATLAVSASATVASDLPASFTVCPNSTNEQIAVTATGTGLTFEWQTRANSAAAWAIAPVQYVYPNSSNGSRYQFPGSVFPNGQQFRVQITSTICSTTTYSQIATLTLRQAPVIAVQPTSLTFCANTSVILSVSATSNNNGDGSQYDWQYLDGSLWISASGNGFAGQGTSQLTVSGTQVVEGRKFRVVVGDGYGYSCLVTTSDEVMLIMGTPVVFASQPLSQTALPNSPVSFIVSTTGTSGTVLYQWESRANTTDVWTALTEGANVSGVTTATLTVSYTLQGDGRQFRVKLNSISCSTPSYSDVATLTIKTLDLAVKNVTSDRTTVGSNDVVTVSWLIANDGTASSPVDWSERIYLQSPTGANRTLIKQITFANSNSLASTQSIPRSETLTIPAQLLIDDQAVFVVEVIPGSSIQEAPGAQANNVSIQQSAWSIRKELFLALSASEVTEGNATGITATVSRIGSLATSLTVTVGTSNPSRFSYPAFVVIPVGNTGVSFVLSVPDNMTIEGETMYQLQVAASGYQGAQADLSVLDNDTPSLAIVNLPTSTTEGQIITFNVTTDLAPVSPMTVFLQSSGPARFPVPASVIIPVGSLSAVVSVTLAQNNTPEIDLAVTITAGASNYNPATGTIQVKDDDLPNLELVILASNIPESASSNATQAVLRRTSSSSSIAFTANLSASLPNTLLLPGAISLAEGENEKSFTIGVVDNNLVDGPRSVTVTASLFVASCGCNAPPTSSGSVSATVVVNDNDGPSLKLTVSQQTLLEGLANAGSLRITRNGSTTDALSVTLTSSNLTEATLAPTVVIPVGQAFVDVAITTLDDGITDGNQTVYFTATAVGLSPGSVSVVVTDSNKPDLQIPLVQLTADKVPAGSNISYQVSVRNSGSATASSGTVVRGYLSTDNVFDASDIKLSEDVLDEAIPAGQTKIISKSVKAPDNQGLYKLIFWVNPDATLAELLLTNNVSTPISLTVEPSYTATAAVGPTYFLQGSNIPVTGSATKLNGSPAANVPVEIYLLTQGVRRVVSVVTDGSGNYSTAFTPSANESGHYSLGASTPGSNQTTAQDEFDILGVRINEGNTPRFELVQNVPITGVLKVQNLSDKSLAGFTIKPIGLPGGVSMQFGTIAQLKGNATADLSYQIVGSILSTGDNFNIVNFEAIADEGVVQKQKLYYYCLAPNAFVVANVASFETAVSQASKERIVEIKLFNKGKGATGNVTINLPTGNWITSVTRNVLSSIAPGDSSLVTLRFLALDEVPFDTPISSSIGVVAQNGNSFTIPFTFRKAAEAKGSASITATDQFTYYTNGHPNVQGAKVRIENYFTGELYAEGITDATGIFNATGVPEGKHRVIIDKEKHKSYNGTIVINPGIQSQLTALLEYQAITYTWKVVPTTVQDKYDITLETKFETNVPMPVVTIDLPDSVPRLSAGQQYSFMVTLTNHGLITAKDVVLNLPQDDSEYEFVTNYVTADLLAQQSIQIPVVMRLRTGNGRIGIPNGRQMSTSGEVLCRFMAGVNYWAQCALNVIGYSTAKPVYYSGRCGGPGSGGGAGWTDADIIRYINQYNYWAQIAVAWSEAFRGVFTGGTPGSGPTGTPALYELPKWMTEKKSCQDCLNDIIDAVSGCTPFPLRTVVDYAKCNFDAHRAQGGPLEYVKCFAEPMWDKALEELKLKQIIEIYKKITGKPADEKASDINYIVDELKQIVNNNKGLINEVKGLIDDIKAIKKRLKCVSSAVKAVVTCLRVEVSPNSSNNLTKARKEAPTSVYSEIASNLQVVERAYNTQINWNEEYFGEMIDADGWAPFYQLVNPYITDLKPFETNIQAIIIDAMDGYDIPSSSLQSFFNRWNTSIQARNENVLSPNVQYPDIINWALVKAYSDSLVDNHNYAVSKGLKSVEYMHASSIESLNEIIDGQKDDVCASVAVQFNQQLTMTRESFEGTLEVTNGHPTDAMKNISINIQITDENGTPSNGLFEIQPQSPTALADINAQQSGSVKFIFIPEVGAAPQASKVYKFGGTISYLDPYAKAIVTLPLAAVPITVNPSPNLMLHYFMERNILGDDALTSLEVEPSVPAELAVMVENHGFGPALDMTISSAQPQIVDNEKGLAINFNLIGSNLQGHPKQLGLTNINFGEIPAQQTRIGQWYFTSSLLGKFVSYDAKVVHNSSFGNKDLSLVQGVKLHELTKSIRLYGDLEDGINDFLVNDIFDVADRPDIIYFSQGNRTAKVSPATSGSFNVAVTGPTFTNILTVTPSEAGFNYIKLDDPGNRLFDLVSVTRSDGQVIPLDNAWLTFVTLPVSRSPIYENKFHIVDNFASTSSATYTVVWKPRYSNVPQVETIIGAPEQVSSTQLKSLKVHFNKRIDPATFTYEDLTLTLQGGQNVINSSVVITQLDSATFNVDLSAVTTGSGLYIFTAQAANVKDVYGISGTEGKQVSWSQFLETLSFAGLLTNYCVNSTPQTLVGVPSGGTFSGPGITGATFDPKVAGVGSHTITYSKDGTSVSQSTTVNAAPELSISPTSTTLTCAMPSSNLTAISSTTGLSYRWSGPNSYSAMSATAVATTSGVYSVTAISTSGCTAVASTTVTGDASAPTATLVSSSPLSCSISSVTLTASGGNTYMFDGPSVVSQSANKAIVNLPGVYSVTVVGANGCTATVSTTVTGDASVPTATLINSGPISCSVNSVTLTASGGSTYQFDGPGVVGQSSNTATVNIGGVYSVTVVGDNGCTSVTSTTVTNDASVPTATLTNSGPISCSVNSVTLTASGGTFYTFGGLGVVSQSENKAIINLAGIYSVTAIGANGCSAIASTTVIGDASLPTATLVNSGLLSCSISSVTLTASGGSTYKFSTGATQLNNGPTAIVSAAGVYSVTVIGTNDCTATASTTVAGDASVPTATLVNSGPLSCSATSVTLTAGGGNTYKFSLGATQIGNGSTATVSIAGVYSVTVIGTNGCSAVASTTVTGDTSVPIATLVSSGPLSCSVSSITLTASGGSSYKFSGPGVVSQIGNKAIVNLAGVYSVTAVKANECTAVASTTVTGDASLPTTILLSSGPLSCSASLVTLMASGGSTYRFSNGANQINNGPTATVTTAGVYSVTAIGANGCTAVASTTVIGDASVPTASLTNSGPISCSTTSVTLTAGGGSTYQFSAGAAQLGNEPTATVSAAGIYSVTVVNSNGCSATASTTVVSDAIIPTATLVSSGPLSCSVSSVTLTASGGEWYKFSAGAVQVDNGPTTLVMVAGIYSVTVVGTNGCTAIASTTVTGDGSVPAATLVNSGPISCSMTSVTLTADGGDTYQFGGPGLVSQNGNTAVVNSTGIYSVTAIAANGCTATASTTVTGDASAPTATLINSGPISCSVNSVTLTASGGETYQFSVGATQVENSNIAIVNAAGVYSVTVINTTGCTAIASTTVTGSITSLTATLVSSGPLSCNNSTVMLTAAGGTSYNFSTGAIQISNGPTATVSTAGIYSVTAIAANGCTSTASTTVIDDTSPPTASIRPSSTTLTCNTPTVSLTASGGLSYRWDDGSSDLIRMVSNAGIYSVTVIAANSCTATTSITIVANAPNPDYQALVDLYNATDGPKWANHDKWLSGCSPCGWAGVTCNPNGRVISLYLPNNQLSGTLPTSLSALTRLKLLNLGKNQLTGAIPSSLGKLINLELLYLNNNQFSESIPSSLSALTELQLLDVSSNQVNGIIPLGLSNLTKLNSLNLGKNKLTGPIPNSLSSLSELQLLYLNQNKLNGSLPASFSALTELQLVDISNNQLSGTIPSSLSALSKLKGLSLGKNQLNGSIPASLGQLTKLQLLDLSANQLSGCLPASLSVFCGRLVDFSGNADLPGGGDFAAFCSNGSGKCPTTNHARIGAEDFQVVVRGNPVVGPELVVEVRGAEGQSLVFELWDVRGELISKHSVERAQSLEQQNILVNHISAGLLILRVSKLTQSKTLRIIKLK